MLRLEIQIKNADTVLMGIQSWTHYGKHTRVLHIKDHLFWCCSIITSFWWEIDLETYTSWINGSSWSNGVLGDQTKQTI